MKNYLILVLVAICIALLLLRGCDKPKEIVIDNTPLFNTIDSLKIEYDVLRVNSDQLELAYEKQKQRKDSIIIRIKPQYIMCYDEVEDDSLECLPKPFVDELITSFDSVIVISDSLIASKSYQIENLERRDTIKDAVILNYQTNERVLIKSVKKEKRKKWLFGVIGAGFVYMFANAF